MSEDGFVVSLFISAKLRELSVKRQRVSWKAVNFASRVCRAGCIMSAYLLGVIQGSLGNGAPC